MISIAFRLDDPSPTSDHALEERILSLFAKYRIPITAAVVPFRKSQDGQVVSLSTSNAAHLIAARRAGYLEVALHGHSHVNRALLGSPRSEFATLALSKQISLLDEGKSQLLSVFGEVAAGFVPPWNSYDASTVTAVDQCGFSYLSAGWERIFTERSLLSIIPRTCSLRTIDSALREADRFSALDPILVIVMHPDDFSEYRDPPDEGESAGFTNLSDLERILAFVAERRTRFFTVTLNALEQGGSLRSHWHRHEPSWIDRLPWRFRDRIPKHLLLRRNRTHTLMHSFLAGKS